MTAATCSIVLCICETLGKGTLRMYPFLRVPTHPFRVLGASAVVKTLGSLLGVSTRGKHFYGELLCGACFGSLLNSLVPGASFRHIYPVLLCFPLKKISFP